MAYKPEGLPLSQEQFSWMETFAVGWGGGVKNTKFKFQCLNKVLLEHSHVYSFTSGPLIAFILTMATERDHEALKAENIDTHWPFTKIVY